MRIRVYGSKILVSGNRVTSRVSRVKELKKRCLYKGKYPAWFFDKQNSISVIECIWVPCDNLH